MKVSRNIYLVLFVVIVVVLIAFAFLGGYVSTSTPKGKFTGVTTFQLNIYKGFNFISVPYNDSTVKSTDCDINNNIYHWNSITKEYTQPQQLSELKSGLGYWFVSGKDCSITFMGTKSTETNDIGDLSGTLKKGFSQIGGPIEVINFIDYKGDCSITSDSLYYWNAQTKSYENPIDSIEPGKAYWVVNNIGDCTLKSSSSSSSGGGTATTDDVNTVAGTDTQVPQAIPDDSSIEPTPVFPIPQ